MNEQPPPSAFGDLLLRSEFTVRELLKALSIGHPAMKQRLEDPSLFTLRELRVLSKLLGRPEMEVARLIFEEMGRNPQVVAELQDAVGQAVGRQRAPRTPK